MLIFFKIIFYMAVSGFIVGTALFYSTAMAIDRITLPPLQEVFFSTTKNYMFVVSTPDQWKSMKSFGELFEIGGENRKPLWRKALPHNFRPRFVVVSDKGGVLLLDEWINVKSPYAVMVLDRGNNVVAQYQFDEVQKFLDVAGPVIVKMAKHGIWITSPPKLDGSGEAALVEAAGKVFVIRLSDGNLSLK